MPLRIVQCDVIISAASTAPAPSPYGTAHKQSIQNALEQEKPNNATIVMNTLAAVTQPAPKRRVSRSDIRLESTVPQEMMKVRIPANAIGTSSAGRAPARRLPAANPAVRG